MRARCIATGCIEQHGKPLTPTTYSLQFVMNAHHRATPPSTGPILQTWTTMACHWQTWPFRWMSSWIMSWTNVRRCKPLERSLCWCMNKLCLTHSCMGNHHTCAHDETAATSVLDFLGAAELAPVSVVTETLAFASDDWIGPIQDDEPAGFPYSSI